MSSRLVVALLACMPAAMCAADSVTLTLPEAVRLALAQNRVLKISRLKVQEKEPLVGTPKATNLTSQNGGLPPLVDRLLF